MCLRNSIELLDTQHADRLKDKERKPCTMLSTPENTSTQCKSCELWAGLAMKTIGPYDQIPGHYMGCKDDIF